MKKLFGILLLALQGLLSTCSGPEPRQFTGYIVFKEHAQAHMSNKEPNKMQEASLGIVIVPHATTPPPPPHKVDAYWRVWVANRDEIETFYTDSLNFSHYHCGQKITFTLYH